MRERGTAEAVEGAAGVGGRLEGHGGGQADHERRQGDGEARDRPRRGDVEERAAVGDRSRMRISAPKVPIGGIPGRKKGRVAATP